MNRVPSRWLNIALVVAFGVYTSCWIGLGMVAVSKAKAAAVAETTDSCPR